MKTIETKSLLIGLLFGICILLALGAASGNREAVGRYQISAPGGEQFGCFVIDTKTGQVWEARSASTAYNYGSPASWKDN